MKQQTPTLRVIAGDFDQPLGINGVALRLSALERQLPRVQALVVEQDSALLLDESAPVSQEHEGSASLYESLLTTDVNYPPGCVLPKSGTPLRLYTVIHNLDRDPNWSTPVIELALDNLFALLQSMRLASVAMPALAHRHGNLPVAEFITLLADYLAHHALPWSGELWLLLPRDTLQPSLAQLRTLCDIHQP